MATPPTRKEVKPCGSDRFIPARRLEHHAWSSALSPTATPSTTPYPDSVKTRTPAKESYRRMLEENLHEESGVPTSRVLDFSSQSPRQQNFAHAVLYQEKEGRNETSRRHVSKAAELILDAPDLPDNFYLNLLDWSEKNVVAIGLGEEVYLWNCNNGAVQSLITDGQGEVTSVSWGCNGRTLAIGFSSGTTELWNLSPQRKVRTIPGHCGRVDSISWTNSSMASGGKDSTINCYDVRSDQPIVKGLSAHQDEVCGLRFSPSGNLLASGGNDNNVFVWDMKKLCSERSRLVGKTQPLHHFSQHQAAVKALAWCPVQANILATGGGSSDRSIKLWNTQDGSMSSSFDTGSQVAALEWSGNGKELASAHGFSANTIYVWKYPSFLQVGQLEGHRDRILHMTLSPDGETLATAGADETLRVWKPFRPTCVAGNPQSESRLASRLRNNPEVQTSDVPPASSRATKEAASSLKPST